jgi:hypothetical protein
MKSEEIKAEINALESQRDELSRQIHTKRTAYLEALTNESPYKKGDKVRLFKTITYPTRTEKFIGEGIFEHVSFVYSDAVPIFWKVKKDGAKSLNKWNKYDFDRSEKI